MSPVILILSVICAMLALMMLFARNAITSALCLLGILLMTAGIYGLIGEHLIATIQLVVYAGAIMVLFIFSIMLLNLSQGENDLGKDKFILFGTIALGMAIFALIAKALVEHFSFHRANVPQGQFTSEVISQLGGNTKTLAHALFSQFYISFEVISLALLVAVVGAVVLAKRKFD